MKIREYDQAGVPLKDAPADSTFIGIPVGSNTSSTARLSKHSAESRYSAWKQVLFGRPTEVEFRTAGPYRIYEVPGDALVGIPIVMWKRLETFELRSAAHSGPFIKAALPA